jgi:hypothetical protein
MLKQNYKTQSMSEASTPILRNNYLPQDSRPALKTRRIFDEDDDNPQKNSHPLSSPGLQPQEGLMRSPPQLKQSFAASDYRAQGAYAGSLYDARGPQTPQHQSPMFDKIQPTQSTERFTSGSSANPHLPKAQSFGDFDYRQKTDFLQRQVTQAGPPATSFGGHFQQSPSSQGRGPPAGQGEPDRELRTLAEQKAAKERELVELRKMLGLDGHASASPHLLAQCVDAHRKLKAQEAELKDLKLNYNLLKEETEKQKHDLAKLESGNDLDRIPRTKDELAAQNEKIKAKIKQLNRDYEKTLYDKTLDIEMKARSKMYQIAMEIAVEHIDSQDHELQDLIKRIRQLEAENKQFEAEKTMNSSFVS